MNGSHTKEQAAAILDDLIERGMNISPEHPGEKLENWLREAHLRVAELLPNWVDAATFKLIRLEPEWNPSYPTAHTSPQVQREARVRGHTSALRRLKQFREHEVELLWKAPPTPKPVRPPALDTVVQICDRFPVVASRLRVRRTGRRAVAVNDEHDVHYVLGALLAVGFSDIRPEEPGPSVAASSTRVDFLLKRERILIECKMTRDGLGAKELGNELILDIRHYEARAECDALVIFIFDPDRRIVNTEELRTDLEATPSTLAIRVLIRS